MALPPPPPALLRLRSRLDELPRLMDAAARVSEAAAASSTDRSAFQLALEEILTNVITHGLGGATDREIQIGLDSPAPGILRATISDDAPAYDPLSSAPVDTTRPLEERSVGGLGIHLVRQLMQVCIYERTREGNRFTIERHPHPPGVMLAASRDGEQLTIATAGRLDGLTSPEVHRRIGYWIASGVRHLTWDLSALEYVSSAGLRLFLLMARSQRAAGGTIRFTAPQPAVREVLGIAGLLTALQVEPAIETPPA